jgi:UPF0755 protein
MKEGKKSKRKILIPILLLLFAIVSLLLYSYYSKLYAPNILSTKNSINFLYVKTGWSEKDVFDYLENNNLVKNIENLAWVAEKKNYTGKNVVPGKYKLIQGMNNIDFINSLRAGNGSLEVDVVFNNVRTIPELAGKVSKNIEADSTSICKALLNDSLLLQLGYNKNTIFCMLIPETYHFYWNTDANSFLDRLKKEYSKFWNEQRKQQAKKIGLSPIQVSTLASIVQAEQQAHQSERPRVAGLYINRINKGMRLQSDPTVIYAIGDFSIKRVLTIHLNYESPYNTYLNNGLPPGPINIPEKSSIDAVLNYEKNDYIFMCAKEDFSGYHNFATNNRDHELNAKLYRKALDSRKIFN